MLGKPPPVMKCMFDCNLANQSVSPSQSGSGTASRRIRLLPSHHHQQTELGRIKQEPYSAALFGLQFLGCPRGGIKEHDVSKNGQNYSVNI